MKYIIKSVLFLSLIFSQNEIEGRWHIVGWDNLIMYQFVETDYFEEAGLKYTIYVNTDGEFDDVLDDDYTGGIPDYYNVDGDTITIDYHFGNVVDYQMNFRCEGQVVEFYNADIPVYTLYREFYDYSQCYNMSNECFDLSEIDFGICDMYLGVGWNGYQCDYFSGCDWIIDDVDYSDYLFNSMEECEDSCECEDGEIIDDNPCNSMECFGGQWYEIIIDCAEDMGVPCEGGLYIPPEEGECCSECILFGDINYDYSINILDIVEIVQLVLDGGYNEIVDINYDGIINVLDIIEVIQIILD